MRKTGFTLAELLISLGIIGVIAALTLPALNRNTVEAQIGPKLAKAVSVFEQANMALLNDQGVDALSDSNIWSDWRDYPTTLHNYLKVTPQSADSPHFMTAKDGISYTIFTNASPVVVSPGSPHRNFTGRTVEIDINGFNNRPNTPGEDTFRFAIYDDGSLKPYGGVNWNANANSADGGSEHWKTKCPNGVVPVNAIYCAGSIFEQNLKVLYR